MWLRCWATGGSWLKWEMQSERKADVQDSNFRQYFVRPSMRMNVRLNGWTDCIHVRYLGIYLSYVDVQ
jgi:hypothetical protein